MSKSKDITVMVCEASRLTNDLITLTHLLGQMGSIYQLTPDSGLRTTIHGVDMKIYACRDFMKDSLDAMLRQDLIQVYVKTVFAKRSLMVAKVACRNSILYSVGSRREMVEVKEVLKDLEIKIKDLIPTLEEIIVDSMDLKIRELAEEAKKDLSWIERLKLRNKGDRGTLKIMTLAKREFANLSKEKIREGMKRGLEEAVNQGVEKAEQYTAWVLDNIS